MATLKREKKNRRWIGNWGRSYRTHRPRARNSQSRILILVFLSIKLFPATPNLRFVIFLYFLNLMYSALQTLKSDRADDAVSVLSTKIETVQTKAERIVITYTLAFSNITFFIYFVMYFVTTRTKLESPSLYFGQARAPRRVVSILSKAKLTGG